MTKTKARARAKARAAIKMTNPAIKIAKPKTTGPNEYANANNTNVFGGNQKLNTKSAMRRGTSRSR
jgi:hypothetical protein